MQQDNQLQMAISGTPNADGTQMNLGDFIKMEADDQDGISPTPGQLMDEQAFRKFCFHTGS